MNEIAQVQFQREETRAAPGETDRMGPPPQTKRKSIALASNDERRRKKYKKLTTKLPRWRLVVTKNPGGFLLRRRRGSGVRLHRGSNPVPSKPPPGRNDSSTPMTLEPLVPTEVSVVCPEGGSVKASHLTSYIYPTLCT